MLNALTIDVEDYFQVHALSDVIKFDDWDDYECRIERNIHRLLDILGCSIPNPQSTFRIPIRATFFVLGWIAERYPGLVQRIQELGHEIACHGYSHKLVYTQSEDEFRQDIRKAKAILEDITGSEVIGHRAPSYSITNKSQWAFDILVEEGFRYDSSIFPIRHDFYGIPNAPRFPFIISLDGNKNFEFSLLNFELGTAAQEHSNTAAFTNSFPHSLLHSKALIEFPASTVRVFGQNFPISGGGYFRLFPYAITKSVLGRINQKEEKPFIFYMHPWEIDPEQPRINGLSSKSKLRHYVNLDKTESKFNRLLCDFQFSSIRELIEQCKPLQNGSTS